MSNPLPPKVIEETRELVHDALVLDILKKLLEDVDYYRTSATMSGQNWHDLIVTEAFNLADKMLKARDGC